MVAKKYIVPVPQGTSRVFGNGHNGIDYLTPIGTPVKASGDGVVEFEGQGANHSWITWMGGITILLKHDDGFSGYSHLSRTIVNRGDAVKQGQVIGYSGNTGNVLPKPTPANAGAGAHLHFDFLPLVPNFKNSYSGRVNPENYFSIIKKGGSMANITREEAKALQNVLRVLNSEVKGWDRHGVHAGKNDAKEVDYLAGMGASAVNAIARYSQQAWDEGVAYRALKDKWKAAFDAQPGLLKKIDELAAQLKAMPADTNDAEAKLQDIRDALGIK